LTLFSAHEAESAKGSSEECQEKNLACCRRTVLQAERQIAGARLIRDRTAHWN